MKTHVIYHDHCADGFGAAWAVWMKLGEDGVQYHPAQYGKPMPVVPEDGDTVIIVDFSYKSGELTELARRCKVLVLDHHATAETELRDLPFAKFDKTKSGAVLAWEHFHPLCPVPNLLLYVQDRDLWKWEMPDSREFSAGLRSLSFDFGRWKVIAEDPAELQLRLKLDGRAILREQKRAVESAVGRVEWLRIDGHSVPVLNATNHISEIGEALLAKFPEAPFSATCFFQGTRQIWSLRSRTGGFNVGDLARKFGGGGHPCAAGFERRYQLPVITTVGKET